MSSFVRFREGDFHGRESVQTPERPSTPYRQTLYNVMAAYDRDPLRDSRPTTPKSVSLCHVPNEVAYYQYYELLSQKEAEPKVDISRPPPSSQRVDTSYLPLPKPLPWDNYWNYDKALEYRPPEPQNGRIPSLKLPNPIQEEVPAVPDIVFEKPQLRYRVSELPMPIKLEDDHKVEEPKPVTYNDLIKQYVHLLGGYRPTLPDLSNSLLQNELNHVLYLTKREYEAQNEPLLPPPRDEPPVLPQPPISRAHQLMNRKQHEFPLGKLHKSVNVTQ
eukprot:TRINITY_DN2569_c0_g3_i2.p1 TRINITY_DN2569_c0_g3~~TRINITY_DN2569_c0_g3_i2.p1  ORF type:complete len:274 (-),score=46.10 TRINITY_DN2569_c0_g3_i2:220-1041(-)